MGAAPGGTSRRVRCRERRGAGRHRSWSTRSRWGRRRGCGAGLCRRGEGRGRGWHHASMWTILDHMQRTSLVEAKAHLSELVDAAEHRGQRILILRHGKPAAAIVPVKVAEESARHRLMTRPQAEAFLDEITRAVPKSSLSI